jgi:hypothetical protein
MEMQIVFLIIAPLLAAEKPLKKYLPRAKDVDR